MIKQFTKINLIQAAFTTCCLGSVFNLDEDAGRGKETSLTVSIVLTTCDDEEFTCRDGFCIDMAER